MSRLVTRSSQIAVPLGRLSFPGGSSASQDGCLRIIRPNSLGSGFSAFGGRIRLLAGSNTQTGVTANANYSGTNGPIWVDDDNTNGAGLIPGFTGGRPYLSVNIPGTGQRTIIGATDIRGDDEHHVEFQRFADTGLMRILLDGQVDAEFTGPAGSTAHNGHPTSTNGGIYVGIEKLRLTNGLTHLLREFYILNAEIHPVTDGSYVMPSLPMQPQAGVLVLYHFGEDPQGTAGVVIDSSGNEIDGALEGDPLPTWEQT